MREPNTEKIRYRKPNLPQKLCPVCLRTFEWRKKWEKNWDEVKYCSQRCKSSYS